MTNSRFSSGNVAASFWELFSCFFLRSRMFVERALLFFLARYLYLHSRWFEETKVHACFRHRLGEKNLLITPARCLSAQQITIKLFN